jgi:hypothetical protein
VASFVRELNQAFALQGFKEPRLEQVGQSLQTFNGLVAEHLSELAGKANSVQPDELESSFMVYCDRGADYPPVLRVVAASYPQAADRAFDIEIGDGNAGRAYKLRIVRSYDAVLKDSPKQHTYVSRGSNHEVLFSIPILHPETQHLIFGVVNFGTYSKVAGDFLRFFHDADKLSWLIKAAHAYVLPRALRAFNIEM